MNTAASFDSPAIEIIKGKLIFDSLSFAIDKLYWVSA
jgi:cell division cycle 14